MPKHTAGWVDRGRVLGSVLHEGPDLSQDQTVFKITVVYQSGNHTGRGMWNVLVGWLLWSWTWFLLSFPHFPGHRDFLISLATMIIGKVESSLSGLTHSVSLSGVVIPSLTHTLHFQEKWWYICISVYNFVYMHFIYFSFILEKWIKINLIGRISQHPSRSQILHSGNAQR